MPRKSYEAKRQAIRQLVRRFDAELRREFDAEYFSAGYCLLLGRYYAQSSHIYFSLNPGFPRNGPVVDPVSPAGYNVPFRNPESLRKQYAYLHNCERFFSAYPLLQKWINYRVTSAFLVPWRTSNMSELYRLNQLTDGRMFYYAGQLAKQVIRDHEAALLITAGKSAITLMRDIGLIGKEFEEVPFFGPGKSYQWSKRKFVADGREVNVLQIPHFSRANSPVKMRELGSWLMQELNRTDAPQPKRKQSERTGIVYSPMMENSDQIRTRLLARQAELEQEIRRYREDALQSGVAEVQDEIDQVISSEAKTASMGLSSRQFLSLQDVHAALARLDNGTYGKCVVCGRPIEPARLRAIPETPYCIEHAKQAETTAEDDDAMLSGSSD